MVARDGQSVQYGLDFISIMERDGLAGVDLRHLRALVAIAETCSFARAGERLGYAQSAVSQQIGALERAVGTQLVERPGGPRPVSLTEAGAIFVEHARAILNRLGAAQDDLDALAAGEAGTIRVGTFQSAGARLLPAILQAFRERHPRITVELTGATSDSDLLGDGAGRRPRRRVRDRRLERRALRRRGADPGPVLRDRPAHQPAGRQVERPPVRARRAVVRRLVVLPERRHRRGAAEALRRASSTWSSARTTT